MPTLEVLNRKIKTAHDLLGVVRTMKSLAAVNIRQFERAVASLEQYRQVVDLGWTVFLRMGRPMDRPARRLGSICLVVGSDQGMCGQFNESLWLFTQTQTTAQGAGGENWGYWSVGEKMHGILTDALGATDAHLSAPASLNAVSDQIIAVVGMIEARRSAKKLEQFAVCHHVLGEHGGYTPVFQRILPLDASWAEERRSSPWPNRCLPMLGASRDVMFAYLFRQYLFISFYRAFAQSLAAENAARLMAMQAAEKNILDLLEELQARFREQRQAGITNELLDIISGFEALSDDPAII
ncbi:F0F1 ATP synthase subunit gamma [Desulfosarcina variabilis]|uniref:F0F1 ATP synthase subunit gamma n=1 Tax=Desulfosarcina variabilis TaxID=2300 RepID=UPI003AFA76AC